MATATSGTMAAPSARIEERLRRGEFTPRQVEEFREFLDEVDDRALHHRIITDNAYTRWFREGTATDDELRHFVRQFSVFSNQFLVAALLRVINAPTLQQARAAKEILMNELGVIYRRVGPGGAVDALERRGEGPRGRPRAGQHRGDGRRRHLPLPGGPFRVAPGRGRGARARLLRPRQAQARPSLHAPLLRRVAAALRQRRPPDRRGGQLRRRELGGGRLLAGARGWADADQAGSSSPAEDRVLHLAQPRRGPARRPHAWRSSRTSTSMPASRATKFFQGGREVLDAIAGFWDGLDEDRLNPLDDSSKWLLPLP